MNKSLANHIIKKISKVKELYFRLILLVGPSDCGKTKLLQELSTLTPAPIINVNLELSRALMELSERQRILQLTRILNKIVSDVSSHLVLLILLTKGLEQGKVRIVLE